MTVEWHSYRCSGTSDEVQSLIGSCRQSIANKEGCIRESVKCRNMSGRKVSDQSLQACRNGKSPVSGRVTMRCHQSAATVTDVKV
jgi:hypothetical protein